jgi:hypothetical protein
VIADVARSAVAAERRSHRNVPTDAAAPTKKASHGTIGSPIESDRYANVIVAAMKAVPAATAASARLIGIRE